MVASQEDRTHIYCTTGNIKDGDTPGSSSSKRPSSGAAIGDSGQPFSRMESFRRSFVHVDFLIRRKHKKDKRRNTVSAGDVKDFKDAFPKIANEDYELTLPPHTYQQIIAKPKNAHKNQIADEIFVERNNNTATLKSMEKISCFISEESENGINHISNGELNLGSTENTSSKRKPKSHIPISTVSAAMNVAVEMRQRYSITRDSGISDNQKYSASWCNHHDESWTSYKKRLQEKQKSLISKRKDFSDNSISKDVEVSSTTSSENVCPENNLTQITSAQSDTFFVSSDESDDDYSHTVRLQESYGSSMSLHTASDGSLNSLLSGTEMTSSTCTLASLEQDHQLAAPPPPPPMILSATPNDKNFIDKVPDTESFSIPTRILNSTSNTKDVNEVQEKKGKKVKVPTSSKPSKTDRNLTENSKTIFSGLVNLKMHTKDKNKSKYKDVGKKNSSMSYQEPAFDMYGSSNTKEETVPTFIKGNISSAIQNEAKNDLKSFCVKDRPFQLSNNEIPNKLNSSVMSDKNISYGENSHTSKVSVTKAIHSVSNIPPKYEHQVKVKPIQRCKETENKIMSDISRPENFVYSSMPRESSRSLMPAPKILRPNLPVTQDRPKAARVVLDYSGRVIYSTNSLDRKHYNPGYNVNMYDSVQNSICDTHLGDMEFYQYSCQETCRQQIPRVFPATSYSSYKNYEQGKTPMFSNLKQNEHENEPLAASKSYHLEQAYDNQIPQSQRSENMEICELKRTDNSRQHFSGSHTPDICLNYSHMNINDPNISGLPVQKTMLKSHNAALHSQPIEEVNRNALENYNRHSTPNSLSPSQNTSENIFNKSPQSAMSTEDLFAVIHSCKKRMNIKTHSDTILTRSSSPSDIRPSSSRSNLAETGFLSPRCQLQLETSGDRKSWADFRPIDSVSNERKCLASDRLGPTKPTSMHDFKMLLLQARSSSQISGPRKSAVEMLKIPSNQNKNAIHSDISPNTSTPRPTELSIHYGHSTVPFKRGNRQRTSLQPRCLMYPPIFEEDSESVISNKSSTVNKIE